ncbi:MAG: DNA mismatch repair protein MutS [Verrucomicrobiia bacterium]
MPEGSLTPMMKQYWQMKKQLPSNTLLLFRLGDFYELFFEDAQQGSKILNLALTQRNGTPMCGMPYHAANAYITKLITAGKRVAICDQMEAPRPGQVVKREITQVLSPGSVVESETLDGKKPNYLAAIFEREKNYGFAFLDTTTGDFRVTECLDQSKLQSEIAKILPSEIIIPDESDHFTFLKELPTVFSKHEPWSFQYETAYQTLRDHFKTQSLDGFGCQNLSAGISAAGALLHYATTILRRSLAHIQTLRVYQSEAFMVLDETTRRTLELVEPARANAPYETTLLGVLDHTCSPLGGRRLRDWVLHPLREKQAILARQDAITFLLKDSFPLKSLRDLLSEIRDIERCIGRLTQGSGSGRDLLALRFSLEKIPLIQDFFQDPLPSLLQNIKQSLHPLPEVVEKIKKAIHEECPPILRDGGVIASGFNSHLDELRSASTEGKQWILQLQQKEQDRTGIKSLKVRYNSVFGYYIEVTKANLNSVPTDYHRKQTTVNAERFITPELKEMESKILGAEEKAKALEQEIFQEVRQFILQFIQPLQQTAEQLGVLDALTSLTQVARLQAYQRPEILEESCLEISEGRHPVLEQLTLEERFVPNDTFLNSQTQRLIILPGPNMAGKSTYLRQVALLTLMAHLGSYVPAKNARIGLVDRIFTRVGASDDLSRGQSTFMVEMNETANILHHATSRSLVVLDEIGRGTSTFDGLSIAWSVAEFLHNEIKALTLFATHYHETSSLSQNLAATKLMNVAVREWNDQVIFLRKIVEGSADKSYGIQVARLAGLPKPVLERAKILLQELEENQITEPNLLPNHLKKSEKKIKPHPPKSVEELLPGLES